MAKFSAARMTGHGRIFCIGLNKTATSSLHEALTILGFRSLHWGGPETRALVRRGMAEGKPLMHYLAPEIEAVSDLEEVTHNFELADRQYPRSRFIYTTRNLDAWLDSRRRHVERNRRRKAAGEYRGRFLEVDFDAWVAEYRRHDARVREYFARRQADLLVIDVADAPGWDALCRFLGRPVPEVAFPHANRYRPWVGAPVSSAQRAE